MDHSKETQSTVVQSFPPATIPFPNHYSHIVPRPVAAIFSGPSDVPHADEICPSVAQPAGSLHVFQPDRIEALVLRAEQLDTGTDNCLDPRHSAGDKFWDQGTQAFCQDFPLEDCPLPPGPEQDDWLRGWMAAQFISTSELEDEFTPPPLNRVAP